MNIKVGEYIRTKQGDISKVRYIDEESIFLEDSVWSKNDLYEKTDVLYFDDEEIVKHSKNIIDLIEAGDYVNGFRVRGKTNEKVVVDYYCYSQELCDGQWLSFREKQIASIVTKEQFKNMEYRV